MKNILAVFYSAAIAQASVVTNSFLDRVAEIESNNNPDAVGDAGKAIGAYQLHEAAFKEACRHIGNKTGQHTLWNDIIAKDHKRYAKTYGRALACAYLQILEGRMNKEGIKVSRNSLYMAYNMGFEGARKFDFNYLHNNLDKKRKAVLHRASVILSR
jgi:hypothetical protein